MNRITLTDGSDRWFDADAANVWEEATWWNGSNHVSKATGDQFQHEALYRTTSGIYVLHHWSQWQGSKDSWTEIDADDAARWLSRNEHGPTEAKEAGVADQFAELEIK